MTYILKMARAVAPAIDRAARRVHDGGYPWVFDRTQFSYRNTMIYVEFASEDDYRLAAGVLAEELRADGFGWTTTYDNKNARTGKMTGMRVTHPRFLTQTGDEIRNRPSTWRIEGPMPHGRVPLDAETIERLAQEAAEVMRNMLREQSIKEYATVPPGTYDLPVSTGNPLETVFHRDVAEHNEEPVDAPKPLPPRPLNQMFTATADDDDEETDQ